MEQDNRKLEELFEELTQVLGKLENDETPLEEAFQYYSEGIKLVQACNTRIDQVEKQIKVLSESAYEGGVEEDEL